MPLLGIGVVFLGYSVLYYGITQVRGANWGLLDLVIPGKFDPSIPYDPGSSSGGNGSPGSVGGPPAAPGTAGGLPIVTPNPSGTGGTTSGTPGVGVTQPPAGNLL
jgi:hypothetical protein